MRWVVFVDDSYWIGFDIVVDIKIVEGDVVDYVKVEGVEVYECFGVGVVDVWFWSVVEFVEGLIGGSEIDVVRVVWIVLYVSYVNRFLEDYRVINL